VRGTTSGPHPSSTNITFGIITTITCLFPQCPLIFHSWLLTQGDNLTGAGAGDDEVIHIRLGELPPEVTDLVIMVTIYTDNKSFANVHDAYVRLVDTKTKAELVRWDSIFLPNWPLVYLYSILVLHRWSDIQ
jgi:hypothetical protein